MNNSKIVKKLLSIYVVILVFLTSFSIIFVKIIPSCEDGDGASNTSIDTVIVTIDSSGEGEQDYNSNDGEEESEDTENLEPVIEDVTETKELYNIPSGEKTEVNLENSEETSINSIRLKTKNDLKNVKLTVTKLNKRPGNIAEDPKPEEITKKPTYDSSIVYEYLDIKLTANNTYIEEDDIDTLTIKFRVNRIWIKNNNINKTTITLMRYHDGKWQNLTTKLINDTNETYVEFEAETPGLSTFAVVGGNIETIEHPKDITDNALPWELIIISIILTLIVLIIVLFKARYIYIEKE